MYTQTHFMPPSRFTKAFASRVAAWLVGAAMFAAAPVRGQAPASQPSAADIEVNEWVVFIIDANQPKANAKAMFGAGVPPFVSSHRASSPEASTTPVPMGVLRVTGRTEPDAPIDVLLSLPAGTELHASWPKAQVKSGRVLWRNLAVAVEPQKSDPAALPDKHWAAALRSGGTWLTGSEGRPEQFLLYDAEFELKSPLSIASGESPGTLDLSVARSARLFDVSLFKKSGETWNSGHVETIGDAPPPAAKAIAKPLEAAAAFDGDGSPPSSSQPTTMPSTQPIKHSVALSAIAGDRHAVLQPWRDRLAAAGVPASDIGLVLSILQAQALDDRWLSVVYRMDPAELDRLLPLEITPAPKRVTRVALVILRNVDPTIAGEIDTLIAQCGDADYQKRVAATRLLTALGTVARPKLEKAAKHKDPEIAFRVERILSTLTPGAAIPQTDEAH